LVGRVPYVDRRKKYEVRLESHDGESVVTARLSRPAAQCYRLFCDAERIHEWLIAVVDAKIIRRDADARAIEVEFRGTLDQATVVYTLDYEYDDASLRVQWTSGTGSLVKIVGSARFTEIDDESCWMRYRLISERAHYLPKWDDLLYEVRPAETVVLDFCDWVTGVQENQ
jgi:uncharacterized membrane protein